MQLKPSAFLLNLKPKLREIVTRLSEEFIYVSILGTDVDGATYSLRTSGAGAAPSRDQDRGFVLRVFQTCGFTEYSFNHVDVEEVIAKVKKLAQVDRERFLTVAAPQEYPQAPHDEACVLYKVMDVDQLPEEMEPGEVLRRLQELHDEVKDRHPELVQLAVGIGVTQVNKLFLSKNKDLYQSYLYANAHAFAVASDGEKTIDDYMTISGLKGYDLLADLPEACAEASRRAVELLSSQRLVPGTYDIICDPDFTGLIAHEAFGHGAEMDMYVKNRAKGAEYMNKRVASDKVVMHDGAASAREVSSYYFDDEGNLASDTVIIDQGILRAGMCDELSGLILGVKPTGNGKRESYKRKAYTRMTNTFFAEGTDNLDEMIASIEHGYLLEGYTSGMEDPKNWGIQCVASKGREIKGGKLTGVVVSPVYLTGYVPDLLQSISMVSPGLKLSGSGYCGKGWKEWVKTSTGGSYIKARGKLS